MKNLTLQITHVCVLVFCLLLLSSSINAQTAYWVVATSTTDYFPRTCADSPSPITVSTVLANTHPPLPGPVPVTVTMTGGYQNGRYTTYNPTRDIHGCPSSNGFTPNITISFSHGVSKVDLGAADDNGATVVAIDETGKQLSRTFGFHGLGWTARFPYPGEDIGLIKEIKIFGTPTAEGWWDIQVEGMNLEVSKEDDPTQNPLAPPRATDSSFVATDQPGLNTGCTYRSSGPLRIEIPIDRVVGDLDPSSGKLEEPESLIDNHIISRYATLRLPAWDVNYWQGEVDHVVVNGVEIGEDGSKAYLEGTDKEWVINEFLVPIDVLNFGKRVKGQPATPGMNIVEIFIDEVPTGNRSWCTSVAWASLSFKALYPVVMVHGNNSCPEFFAGDYACTGQPHPDFRPEEYFVHSFIEQKIPYDNSIRMATNTIDNHGVVLKGAIPRIAAEFGARHVHIIAHSKGGLDVRKWLTLIEPGTLGVLSFTTLSTPHWGSVGADYVLDAEQTGWKAAGYADSLFRTVLSKSLGTDLGTADLRISAMRKFNRENIPQLPKSFTVDGETTPFLMYSTGGDANLDNSSVDGKPTISVDETKGTPWPLPMNFLKADVYQMVHNLMGTVHHTQLVPRGGFPLSGPKMTIKEFPTTAFRRNDFLVTVKSSNLLNLEIAANPYSIGTRGFIPANHATIATSIMANGIIRRIQRDVQPIQ
jgi:hypothetical protein